MPRAGFTLGSGAEVRGRVVTAVPAKRVSGHARLVIAFDSVTENGKRLPIITERIDTTGRSTSSKDKKILGGGALGGLLVGALKDGTKGAVMEVLRCCRRCGRPSFRCRSRSAMRLITAGCVSLSGSLRWDIESTPRPCGRAR